MDFLHRSKHEKFHFKTLDQLLEKAKELGFDLPHDDDLSILGQPVRLSKVAIPNSLAVQAMEGCDGTTDGRPGELTFRRYTRFGAGGAGLLWMEATAVVPEGRANPRQLWITRDNVDAFRRLHEEAVAAAKRANGDDHTPVMILQLTHSGRYSKPTGKAAPMIAHHSPYLDPTHHLSADYPVVSDEYLDALQDRYVEAARLAYEAGFDGVDVKACHGYLVYEILGAHTRTDSKYGGSFENRIRFLTDVVRRIKEEVPGLILTSRLSVYDATPYPYGFGMATDGSLTPDLTEPIELIKRLHSLGVEVINVAIANPYYNPHVERPFDTPVAGAYVPEEHPLANIGEFARIIKQVSRAVPEVKTVYSGISWLRQFIPQIGAGLKKQGYCDIIGAGRAAFACPHFAKDILEKGYLVPSEQCIACSSCTQIMRDGGRAGCPVRDAEIYGPIYKAGRMKDPTYMRELASKCRDCSAPTCREKCPAGVDIPGFVQAIAQGNEREAYAILHRSNALPEVCAHVCPSEEQCEGGCVQQHIGCGSVPIRALQQYVCEKARTEGWTGLELPRDASGKRVAVVGAGPAGLACATRLLECGHVVAVFDASERPGGAAMDVIPELRLPGQVMQDEIRAVLGKVPEDRLSWHWGVSLGADYQLSDLVAKYDAVFLGIGLTDSSRLTAGERPSGVVDALTFLREMKSDPQKTVQGVVAVIGGGNTAMDAAVTAARRGASDVYVIYRRSYKEMPAWPGERANALEAGVHFLVLQQPLSYVADADGKLRGVKVARTQLGQPDASGRRRPEVVARTEQVIPVDMVIEAIGQKMPDHLSAALEGVAVSGGLVSVSGGHATTKVGVFAGGDVVNGGMTVVQAVADGYQAATEIDEFLSGKKTQEAAS